METNSIENKIYVADSKVLGAGKGVFSGREIVEGELIESCPFIMIDQDNTEYLSQSILATYLFYFGDEKEKSALVLGFGSLYNHSKNANARYVIKEEERKVYILCVRRIKKGEEILIKYDQDNRDLLPLWFE